SIPRRASIVPPYMYRQRARDPVSDDQDRDVSKHHAERRGGHDRSDVDSPWMPSLFSACRRLTRCCSASPLENATERSSLASLHPVFPGPPPGFCKGGGRLGCLWGFGHWSPFA